MTVEAKKQEKGWGVWGWWLLALVGRLVREVGSWLEDYAMDQVGVDEEEEEGEG